MLKVQIKSRIIILFLGEGLILFLGVLLAAWVRFTFSWDRVILENSIIKALLITLVCQITLYYCDVYNLQGRRNLSEIFLDFLRGMGIAYIILAFIYYLFPEGIIGRGIGVLSFIFILLSLTLWRSLYDRFLTYPQMKEAYLILGTGNLAQRIAKEVLYDPGLGIMIEGFLGPENEEIGQSLVNPKVLGVYEQVFDIAQEKEVHGIVVALNERRGILPVANILKCKLEGIKVVDGTAFLERISGKISVEDLRPSWMIFSEGFHRGILLKGLKSFCDIFFSLIGLLLSWPLMILVALAIKVDSSGPVFYRQRRVGQKGKEFDVLKFRSMSQDAEINGPQWAEKEDPRVTKVGSIIRKLRIDELPQLFNVLQREMSFIGPRPERPEFVSQLQEMIPYYLERHTVKPGITGWAQVKFGYGQTVEDSLEKLQYDLYYIKNMSFFLDLLIVFQTIKVVLLGRGAL